MVLVSLLPIFNKLTHFPSVLMINFDQTPHNDFGFISVFTVFTVITVLIVLNRSEML